MTRRPPHRSRRAELPHRAPASGDDAKPLFRIGTHDFRARQPPVDDLIHPPPPGLRLVAAAVEPRLPELADPPVEAHHRGQVARHRMVAVLPAHHCPQPSPGLGDGLAHSIPQSLPDLLELRSHPLADRLPVHDEFASGSGHVTLLHRAPAAFPTAQSTGPAPRSLSGLRSAIREPNGRRFHRRRQISGRGGGLLGSFGAGACRKAPRDALGGPRGTPARHFTHRTAPLPCGTAA